jgi:hypothetical protein
MSRTEPLKTPAELYMASQARKRVGTVEILAKDLLDIETLDTRNSDSLDFHTVSVWQLKAALEAAYEAGRQS